jgi:hypothetical protein
MLKISESDRKMFSEWFKKANIEAQGVAYGSGSSANHARAAAFNEVAQKIQDYLKIDNLFLDLHEIFKNSEEDKQQEKIKNYLK